MRLLIIPPDPFSLSYDLLSIIHWLLLLHTNFIIIIMNLMTKAETDHIYLHLNSDSIYHLKRIGGIIISTLSAQSSFIRAVAFLLHRGFCRS